MTDDVFMLGDLKKHYSGADVGFIPAQLIPRLGFQVVERDKDFLFYHVQLSLTTISVSLDGECIGGICIERTWSVTCRTYHKKTLMSDVAERFSADGIPFAFRSEYDEYHPTFHSLSELLLYHLSQGV